MSLQEDHHPWIRDIDWRDCSGGDLLETLLKPRILPERAAIVLDLDSTLFSVLPRTKQIFFDYIRSLPKTKPYLWRVYEQLGSEVHAYSVREMFELALAKEGVSMAKELSREIWSDFEPYWMANFFRGYYMHYDLPYPGAVDFVKRIYEKNISVLYVTGREYAKAYGGTLRSLKERGFPTGENTRLFTKPPQWAACSDFEYKKKVCDILASQYEVLCAVDNEPENLLIMAKCFQNAEIALFHSQMSKRVPLDSLESYRNERSFWRILHW